MRRSSPHRIIIILFFVSCVVYGQDQIRNEASNKSGNKQQTRETNRNTPNAAPIQNSNLPANEPSKTVIESDKDKNQMDWARSSAKAAWYQAYAGWTQAIAGVIVLVLIVLQAFQIKAQGKDVKQQLAQMATQAKTMDDALKETRKAALASERQAFAAEQSIKFAKENRRAYLYCKDWKNPDPKVEFTGELDLLLMLLNSGQTPAFRLRYAFFMHIYSEGKRIYAGEDPKNKTVGEGNSKLHVFPNAEMHIRSGPLFVVPEDRLTNIKSGTDTLYFTCKIYYEYVPGEDHEEIFYFNYDADEKKYFILSHPPADILIP
jgi:hypothetical protein